METKFVCQCKEPVWASESASVRHCLRCQKPELDFSDSKNQAAQALRAIPSEKRTQASRENGKKGGRPKKITE